MEWPSLSVSHFDTFILVSVSSISLPEVSLVYGCVYGIFDLALNDVAHIAWLY